MAEVIDPSLLEEGNEEELNSFAYKNLYQQVVPTGSVKAVVMEVGGSDGQRTYNYSVNDASTYYMNSYSNRLLCYVHPDAAVIDPTGTRWTGVEAYHLLALEYFRRYIRDKYGWTDAEGDSSYQPYSEGYTDGVPYGVPLSTIDMEVSSACDWIWLASLSFEDYAQSDSEGSGSTDTNGGYSSTPQSQKRRSNQERNRQPTSSEPKPGTEEGTTKTPTVNQCDLSSSTMATSVHVVHAKSMVHELSTEVNEYDWSSPLSPTPLPESGEGETANLVHCQGIIDGGNGVDVLEATDSFTVTCYYDSLTDVNMGAIYNCSGKVNSAQWFGISARCCLFQGADVQIVWSDNNNFGWRVTYRFSCAPGQYITIIPAREEEGVTYGAYTVYKAGYQYFWKMGEPTNMAYIANVYEEADFNTLNFKFWNENFLDSKYFPKPEGLEEYRASLAAKLGENK